METLKYAEFIRKAQEHYQYGFPHPVGEKICDHAIQEAILEDRKTREEGLKKTLETVAVILGIMETPQVEGQLELLKLIKKALEQ
jgi:hypothetical protein